MFSNCSSLISLPDISKWKINNINNMSEMFSNCSSLASLPDILKWKIKNINRISMYDNCISTIILPKRIKKKLDENLSFSTNKIK